MGLTGLLLTPHRAKSQISSATGSGHIGQPSSQNHSVMFFAQTRGLTLSYKQYRTLSLPPEVRKYTHGHRKSDGVAIQNGSTSPPQTERKQISSWTPEVKPNRALSLSLSHPVPRQTCAWPQVRLPSNLLQGKLRNKERIEEDSSDNVLKRGFNQEAKKYEKRPGEPGQIHLPIRLPLSPKYRMCSVTG